MYDTCNFFIIYNPDQYFTYDHKEIIICNKNLHLFKDKLENSINQEAP